jgi:hypothetical protein
LAKKFGSLAKKSGREKKRLARLPRGCYLVLALWRLYCGFGPTEST